MRYAAPTLEKKLKGLKGEVNYAQRRKVLAKIILARC
jgi:hypothetical protein